METSGTRLFSGMATWLLTLESACWMRREAGVNLINTHSEWSFASTLRRSRRRGQERRLEERRLEERRGVVRGWKRGWGGRARAGGAVGGEANQRGASARRPTQGGSSCRRRQRSGTRDTASNN